MGRRLLGPSVACPGFDWWLGVVCFHVLAFASIVALFFLVLLVVFSGFDEDDEAEQLARETEEFDRTMGGY